MGNAKKENPDVYSLTISKQAIQNIDQITDYIAYIKHEPINAIHVGQEIFKTIERIEKNPLAFRECSEIPTKNKIYRKAVCLSWLIIYKVRLYEITILGIIHQHQRPSHIKSIQRVK